MPIYNAAMKAVDDLDKNDITEVKGFLKPSDGVKAVIKTLCIMFNVAPEKVKSQNVKEVVYDYWEPAKKKLLTADLLKRLKTYDKDNVNPDIIEKLKPIIALPDYQENVLLNASKAAHGLSKWVKAIVQYDDAMKIVKPK
jgi:dynein heavy chain